MDLVQEEIGLHDLHDDIHRLIASCLDRDSLNNLKHIDGPNGHWKSISETCKINFDGPANSTIFSLASWIQYGSRKMPNVTVLDLFNEGLDTLGLKEELLLDGLKLIHLERKRRHELILNMSEQVYHMPRIRNYLKQFTYKEINFFGQSFFYVPEDLKPWSTKTLKCPCEVFASLQFIDLEDLELKLEYSRSIKEAENISLLKAFKQVGLKKLCTLGPFLDHENMKSLALNTSLESLTLIGYSNSYFFWDNACFLQKSCPNIKHLAIQNSNLIHKDLEHFDWSLWSLVSLDLSFNYTLKSLSKWPQGLKKLRAHETGLDLVNSTFNLFKLKSLSMNVSATRESAAFFSKFENLEQLHLNMCHYLSGYQFDSCRSLVGGSWFWHILEGLRCNVFIRLKEVFFTDNILETHGSFLRHWHY